MFARMLGKALFMQEIFFFFLESAVHINFFNKQNT